MGMGLRGDAEGVWLSGHLRGCQFWVHSRVVLVARIPLGRRGSFLCCGFEMPFVGAVEGLVFVAIFELSDDIFAIIMLRS